MGRDRERVSPRWPSPGKARKLENKNFRTACGEPLSPANHSVTLLTGAYSWMMHEGRAKSKIHSSGEIVRLLFFNELVQWWL